MLGLSFFLLCFTCLVAFFLLFIFSLSRLTEMDEITFIFWLRKDGETYMQVNQKIKNRNTELF